ncbi:hypothetical protein IV203_027611 [Nitzschia inconspicua]|uniref:Uncharacterized protein n=1 Tax=Nitzschia inconspicua TaxID=303405 RepID=A0A9K3Q4A8_9STRA|nr:hypothetical protein IV203_027611 [Nitzschia inconspicua]
MVEMNRDPLITIVDTSDATTSSVETVLKQLVTHFNQEIHQIDEEKDTGPLIQPLPDDNETNGSDSDTWYLPKIVQYWLDEDLSPCPSSSELVEWIRGYETRIRPLLLDFVSKSSESSTNQFFGYIPVVLNYERILSQWLQRLQQRQDQHTLQSTAFTPQSVQQQRQQLLYFDTLYKSIELVSTDLTLLTSERYFPKLSSIGRHVVLRTLLRLLDHSLRVEALLDKDEDEGLDNANASRRENNAKRETSLRRCVVSLLAFPDEKNGVIGPGGVAPTLLDSSKHTVDATLAFPPNLSSPLVSLELSEQDLNIWNKTLDLNGVDWSSVTLVTTIWSGSDDIVKATEGVWTRLKAVVLKEKNPTKGQNDPTLNRTSFAQQQQEIIQQLGGPVPFYQNIRAHFFGRDMVDWQPQMHTSQQVVLGRRVTKSQPVVSDLPHRAIPSRMATALNSLRYLNALTHEERTSTAIWNSLIDELFPIVATLVDSNHNLEIGLGASGFLCLLTVFHQSDIKLSQLGDKGKTNLDNILSVLDLGFKISQGAATVAVGQAQCCAFRILEREYGRTLPLEYRNRRQKITQQWVKELMRFNRPDEDSRRWEVLTGGIVPFLCQMGRDTSTADGMEIGRQTLSVLLPLIDQDTILVDEKTEMVALMGLINLLLAAHPIMPNHGGKILSALLSAAALAARTSALHKLALYTGGVALVICGPKFTDGILNMVQDEQSRFQERLKASAASMVAVAAELDRNKNSH